MHVFIHQSFVVVDFISIFSVLQWVAGQSKQVLFGSADTDPGKVKIFSIGKKKKMLYHLNTTLLIGLDFLLGKSFVLMLDLDLSV